MALSEERRRRLEEEQRKAVQNNLRAAAAADAAKFDLLERQRQQSQRIDQSRINAEIRAQRRAQAEALTAREDALNNLHDYRAINREIWKDSQRPQSDLNYAAQRADRELSAAQRQRDRIRNGNSYWNRQAQAQEQKQYGSYMDRMSQPVRRNEVDEDILRSEYGTDYTRMLDRSQSAQPDLNAASQYGQALGRRQDALNRAEDRVYYARQEKDILERERDYARNGDVAQAVRRLGESGTLDPNRVGVFDTDGKRIARDVYNSVIGNVGMVSGQTDVHIDQMNDVEKATILNMAQDGKWTDIEKFTNALRATLDARWYDTQETRIAQMPTAAQVGYGMLGTFTAPAAYAQVAADTLTGRRTDPKSGAVGATRLAQTAREQSLANAGTVGRFVGNVAYSMADNLTTMALGPTGAIIWLGLSAAGNEAANALANGARQGQALGKATASGIIETATEKIGIDNLFDTVLKSGSRGLKNALKDIAKQFGSEGAEEIISEFANTFADKAIMGQQSEYNKSIRDYEANGLSHDDAVKRANLDFFVKNPGLAGLAGALSGALFGVGGVTTQRIRQGASDLASGRDIVNNRQIADLVLDEGMKSTDERVKALSYALDTVRQENRNSEGFQWSNADLREIGEVYDSLDDAAKKRISDDYAERERTRQEEEAERVRAREAEIQAEQDASAREDAQRALAEREAETDRIVEDAEAIDLDNPEALTEEADTTTRRGSDEYTDRVETAEDVDADMRRRAAAAEEATRTGDRSALDNLEQPRRTTESTAQTNRQTEQQEPVNPTQQRRDMKKQVREVYSSMGITSEVSVGEIADAMQEAFNAIREKGDGSDSLDERKAFLSAAQEHFEEDMLRQAEEDRDRQFGTEDEVYTQARKTIRGTRLYVPQSLNASELGVDSFNEFRRANLGVLNLTRDSQAMPIDTFYDELVREYPGLFPDPGSEGGPTSEADMLRTIAEVYRSRGSAMQAEPIDTDAINAESKRKAMELYRPMVEAAQQAYTTAQTTARQNAEQAGQMTATNARRAGLSAADSLALSNVARDLGVGLEFRKMKYGRVNGFYNRETNTVVLNQDLSTAEMAWTTFAHEIVHAAESAGNYQQLADIAKRISVKDADKGTEDATWRGTVDELRRVYAQEGFKISRESAEHEAVTNILQDVLGSREALEGVARESKANGRALLSDVDNVLDRTTTNNAAITPEAARLAEAQKALAAALNDAQENARYTASVPGQQVEASISGINMDEIIKTAVEKYGRMRSGEQLVNAKTGEALTVTRDDIANKTSDETRTRSGYRTMAETKYLSDLAIKDLAALDQYTPTSNEKNLEAARKLRAESVSLDGAFEKLHERLRSGSFFNSKMSENLAFAELLLQEASQEARKTGNEKYVQMANQIAADIAFIGTEAGQTVQVMSLMKRLSPEGQLEHVQRIAQDYSERHGIKKGKVPKDVQTVMQVQEVNKDLLEKVEELRKLKKLEANGEKMSEDVARRIAELEGEIERLNEKLRPLIKKYNDLRQERTETTKERDSLKRLDKNLPGRIEKTQDRIDFLKKEIDDYNEKLRPRLVELVDLLATEDITKDERNKLKRELDSVKKRIENHRANILYMMLDMTVKQQALNDLSQYELILKESEKVMDDYLRYVKNKGGKIEIPEDLRNAFIDAKNETERDAIRAQINQAIADQMPGTAAEKLRAWRYMAMLANPTTHLRNVFGNGMQYLEKGMRDTFAAGIESVAMKKNAPLYQDAVENLNRIEEEIKAVNNNKAYSVKYRADRLKELYDARAQYKEQLRVNERSKAVASRWAKADKAYFEKAKEDFAIIKKDLQAGGRAAETQDIDELRKIFKNKALEWARYHSGQALETEDLWFLYGNYTQSFAEYLKANNIDPETMTDAQIERARARSFQEALEATYRDASALADLMSKAEHLNPAMEFALGGIMPFKKTPINILKRGVEYSPLGIVRAVYDDIKAHQGKNTKTKTDLIAEYSEGAVGTILFAVGAILAKAGVATATGGDDEKDRKAAMDKEAGYQDYSLKVHNVFNGKDYTYTFDWLMPAAMALFGGVRMYESAVQFGKGKMDATSVIDGIASIANPVFELSMLDGLVSLFKNYSADGADFATSLGWSILQSYILQYAPTVGGKVARIIDPIQRSTYTPKDSKVTKPMERLYRRIMAKIPGASYALEPMHDSHGELLENIGGNWFGRTVYNLLSPGYLKEVKHNLTDEELNRLYKELGEEKTDMLYKETPTYYELDGEKYYLDAHEYARVGEKLGKESSSRLEALMASDEYKNANDTMKAKMVASELDDAAEEAKRLLFEDIGVLGDYLRAKIEPLLYDNSTGETVVRNLADVREIYEQGRLDLKTVEAAAAEIAHTPKTGAKIDTLNQMIQKYNLTQDEYDFLYMTKIANQYMQDDMQAVLDAGGTLDQAINTVARFYHFDANAVDKTTGEAGMWVKYDKGTQAAYLSESKLTAPAKEAFYLNNIVSTNNVEKEQAKIEDYYKRNLSFDDYLKSLGTKYDDEGTAYENNAGFFRELYVSDLSAAVKEAAVYNLARYGGDGADKAQADIDAYKKSGLTVQDYILTKASLYDDEDHAYTKTADKAKGLLESGLSDMALKVAWYTVASDAQGAEDEINAFMKGGNTVKQFLQTKAAASGDNMKSYQKAQAVLKQNLSSYTAAITSIVTSSENQATGIQNCLNAGIKDRKVAEGYAKYAEINANDALNATQKATEFSKWLNTDSSMSGLTTAQKDMMRASFVYFMMTPASAGRYDNLMKLDGMSSKAAESISADIAKLEPKEGSKSVSDLQRLTAVAYNTTASEKQIDLAMQQILDSSDDGTDTAGLTKYRAIRAAGMSAKQYVDFRTNTESITSDKDSNGKDIKGRTRQDKIWAYINSLPITSNQKDALHLVYYKESTLSKTPWH